VGPENIALRMEVYLRGCLNQRIDELDYQIHARIDRLYDKATQVHTFWLIGTIALFGTIATVLLAIAEFAP
jgi:hypothetical protein